MTPYAKLKPVPAPTDHGLANSLRSLLAEALGVAPESIDPTARFSDLGLSSLLAVRCLDRVNRRYGLRLGVEVLFAHSSLQEFAAFLAARGAQAGAGPAATVAVPADAIAVIGMAGRFAAAPDIASFWASLLAGECLVREVPPERWDTTRFYHPAPAPPGRTVSKWAGLLDGIDGFDAGVFGISPREAAAMDPQQRLFLEQAWLAIENAGYPAERLRAAPVGVFVGAAGAGYEQMLPPDAAATQSYGMTGNLVSLLAARIAYALDLRGPALVVDTACSASLVAVHLACQALRAGEVEMALAGGVRLFLDEKPFLMMSRLGMLSPAGRIRSFDAAADGIVIGEAAACVVLKRLTRALADGDRVDAVIRASGTNQDGRSNGITAPNARAQADLLRAVQARAGIAAESVTLLEAHGTGTPLGDPIEFAALREVLPPRPAGAAGCALGSVKTNIGHTSEAAGIAGLIKTVLCLKHATLVPSLGFAALNPQIDPAGAPLEVVTQARPWRPAAGAPLRAGVSAFGLSGTNAHVVLDAAPCAPARPPPAGPFVIALSARSAEALATRCADLAAWLRGAGAAARLDDVARTLLDGRSGWDHRLAFVALDRAGLLAMLDRLAVGDAATEVQRGVLERGAPRPAPTVPATAHTAAADFVAGAPVDGSALYPDASRSLDLPATRFIREVHWAATRPARRHPLLDEDAPAGQTVKTFDPAEPLVRDHVVAGTPILHGGVFLEMARLAATRARGAEVAALADIAWLRPVAIAAPRRLHVSVGADGICLLTGADEAKPFARCRISAAAPTTPPTRDLAALRAAASRHVRRADLTGLAGGAVQLGPSYPGFDDLWLGATHALARLGPAAADPCALPPRLTDAAIQTAVALLARDDGPVMRARTPSGIAAVELLRPVPTGDAWLLAEPVTDGGIDVTLCADDGAVCVLWRGLMLREAPSADAPAPRPELRRIAWQPAPHPPAPPWRADLVIATASDAGLAKRLAPAAPVLNPGDLPAIDVAAAALPARSCIAVLDVAPAADPAAALTTFALHALVRGLARHGGERQPLTLRIVTGHAHAVTGREAALNPAGAALEGMAKAVAAEFPAWDVAVIDIAPDAPDPAAILAEAGSPTGEAVALRDGARWLRVLEPAAEGPGQALRPGGLYLVVGGLGRVGRRLCQALTAACGARLLVIGRQPLDAERAAILATLGEAMYVAADAADAEAVAAAIVQAEERFGRLAGVIQAVVDPLFARTDRADATALRRALHPKLRGLTGLAAALAGRRLDFLAVVSSIGAFAGFPGIGGQSSYAAACCFEAAYAADLRRRTDLNVRVVHCGLWADPALDPAMVARLAAQGCATLEPVATAATFLRLLDAPDRHVVHAALTPPVWEAMGAPSAEGFARAVAAGRTVALAASRTDSALQDQVERYARSLLPPLPEIVASPRHAPLLAALREMAARAAADAPAAGRRAALLVQEPRLAGPLDLLETCAAALPDILAGRREATDVLFPGGSLALVEAVYRDQPVLAACGDVIAAACAACASGPLCIVEIGAGTGATARVVLAALHGSGHTYHYTDISSSFVRHGSATLAGPGRQFAALDIARPPAAQGFAAGMADIVIASNVLHATPDIAATLANVSLLLRPGGIAIVNEMTRTEDFATLTFGLLDGWWLSADPALRLPHGPLLSAHGWRTALRRAGFDRVEAFSPGAAAQTVLFARRGATEPATRAAAAPPQRATRLSKPATGLVAVVREALGEALGLAADRVETDQPFGEMGVDSIVSPQIAEAINTRLGISLRPTDLYNFADVTALVRHIAATFPQAAPIEPERAEQVPAAAATTDDPRIAIIGMAGRFPDAPDVETFWRNIAAGKSAVREVDRFDLSAQFDPQRGMPGRTYAKWAALLADHDRFDPLFFNISPAEAEAMDPQQRLLLEEAWHALEDAGLPPARLKEQACGVFVGVSASNYFGQNAAPALQTLGASLAILSARLSYFLDLQGPAFPVDTGCSSSLVALHLACQSLRSGETRLALAAGVSCNIISPHLFLYLSDAGMASPTGRCHSFDDAADGFVPGEGVGVLVLKRLADALADGDRILGVIAATGINQDGRTSGLTAPSATSQTALEQQVYARAGIDPATIGLVEAHGTGTRLGDPIEIAALTDAFAGRAATQSCAIGSVKTNIGHTMAAAGVAGVLKAVQALRHRTLPPSLNFRTPNRHIDFAATPFFVNTAPQPWADGGGPRRAAVSSFGFSGTNAHVVLEEAPEHRVAVPAAPGARVLLVSARSAEALAQRLAALADWFDTMHAPLADAAATLAGRRAHFRYRRAVVAATPEQAAQKLREAADRLAATGATGDASGLIEAAAAAWRAGRAADPSALETLAAFYESGADLEVAALAEPRPLADLPLYPFARERFWGFDANAAASGSAPAPLHPLLDRNISTRAGLRFETVLDAARPLLRDHRIGERLLLPGTAFLDMALAAAALAGEAPVRRLRDVAWLTPVSPQTVQTHLAPEEHGFAVTLRAGAVVFARAIAESGAAVPGSPVVLGDVMQRCPAQQDGAAVYAAFAALGFAYGPALRVIEHLHVGEGEALGQLRSADRAALLDGALQVTAGIGLAQARAGGPTHVPAALAALDLHGDLAQAVWAHARLRPGDGDALEFDIGVLDAHGQPLATLNRLLARPLAQAAAPVPAGVTALVSRWDAAPLPAAKPLAGTLLLFGGAALAERLRQTAPALRLIRVEQGETFARLGSDRFSVNPLDPLDFRRLLAALPTAATLDVAQCWRLDEPEMPLATLANALDGIGLESGLRATAALVQAVLALPDPPALRLLHAEPLAGDPPPSLHAAAGFARSLVAERSQVQMRVVGVMPHGVAALADELADDWEGVDTLLLGPDGRQRLGRTATPLPEPAPWVRPDSTWLITGGLGGLGLAVARHIAAHGPARLALLGRTAPDAARSAALAALEAAGAEVFCVTADVADPAALRTALTRIRRRFGPLHGIIHAAGVLRDGLVAKQTLADLDAVLAPKVAGTVALDHLTAADPLHSFVLFGSTAAALGVPGQAGYAAANGFLAGFAARRQAQVAAGSRSGQTVAIQWPLWQDGGMQPPAEVAAELSRRLGMVAMPEAVGMAVIGRALALGSADPLILFGDTARHGAWQAATPARIAAPPAAVDADAMAAYLRRIIGEVIHLDPARIDPDEPFEAYGIDSMTITKLNARLAADLGDLPKTLFFEARHVRGLAALLGREHAGALPARAAAATPAPAAARDADIAIIGIAGLYPGASDLDQFWANLRDGRDSITEIPPDRWQLDGFYDPDRARPETSYSKWGGFIDGVAHFDARFFGISPVEADMLDPQARKFLEICWATLEDAGLTRETLFRGDPNPAGRRCGVFVGVMSGDYQLFGPEQTARGNLIGPNAAYWSIANRVSHFLDLHGPSMAIDTACSASLSAIHVACQAIRAGECSVAIAGGTNLSLHPSKYWILSKSGFAASDGRCRSFGAGGDGYVPGEGVGAVLLKPLARALADGDRIHAVVKGGALNHGGRTSGYTVPDPVAQGEAIGAALRAAGTPPATIGYIEAHGTGTALGDPVEVAGLGRAFAGLPAGTLPVGSIKSNIGHLEAAAGIAGVAKVVAQFRAGMLAPSLHAETLNPDLGLARTPLVVQRTLAEWPRPEGGRRRAGVSSFGAGGANAHLVLEEPPDPTPVAALPGPYVVPLSAATPDALRAAAIALSAWLRQRPTAALAAVVRTLQAGREAMRHRSAAVVATPDDLCGWLDRVAAGAAPVSDIRRGAGTVTADADPQAVAQRWMAGEAVDWDALAPGRQPPISLPTYRFEPRRCWFQRPGAAAGPRRVRLDRQSPAIADHLVGGRPVLPGALLLELALDGAVPCAVQGWRFLRPVDAGDIGELSVSPAPQLAIRSAADALHAEGRLVAAGERPAASDLAGAMARCRQAIGEDMIYDLLAAAGVTYGATYRRLAGVRRGAGEAVAEMRPGGGFAAVLDAAFQLTFAVLPEDASGGFVPAGFDRLSLWGDPARVTRVHAVRRSSDPGTVTLDLSLADAAGVVVATVEGFAAQARAEPAETLPPLRVFAPIWEAAALASAAGTARPAVVIGNPADPLAQALGNGAVLVPGSEVPDAADLWLVATDAGADTRAVIDLHRLLRRLHAQPEAAPRRMVLVTAGAHRVHATDLLYPGAAAFAAFAKAAGREHPALPIRLLDIAATDAADAALAPLLRAAVEAGDDGALRAGVLYRQRFETVLPAATPFAWAPGSVVVIAGGSGGLGRALAQHLAARAGCRVALLGRSPESSDVSATLAACTRAGGAAMYVRADLTDPASLGAGLDAVIARFGPIDTAVHAAMVMHDARVAALSEADLLRVLAPKTVGLTMLLDALAARETDGRRAALLVFSSANAHTANPGQSAYAAASAFADALALRQTDRLVRVIDWGLWGEVGRVATAAHRTSMARIGVHPIGTAEGFSLMDRLLATPVVQTMPLRITDSVAEQLGVVPGATLACQAGPAVSLLPAAAAAAAALDAAAIAGAADAFAAINRYGVARLAATLPMAGAGPVVPPQARLHAALQALLADQAAPVPTAADLDIAREALLAASPDAAPYLTLLETCVAAIPDVLAGRRAANDVLFPGGSMALVAPIYAGNRVVDHFQRVLAEAVAAAVAARRHAGATVRVLEVGGGTGGTTGFVLRALTRHSPGVEYVFTDIGMPFVEAARREFAAVPFLTAARLDIEAAPDTQGFAHGSFDVVIAANVLHATRRIDAALANLKALLRPGGLAAINEATAAQAFNTLTFGLTAGWWLFEDGDLRLPHAPLLDVPRWQGRLAEAGLRGAAAFGDPALQCVILAESDGMLRQRAAAAPAPNRPAAVADGPETALEERLRHVVAAALRLTPEEVELATSFAEYGADSIISVDLVRQINAAFGIELKSTALFNYATVRELAAYMRIEFSLGDPAPAAGDVSERMASSRERTDRLRRIIRRRLSDPPAPAAQEEEQDGEDVLAVLQRLERGEIDYDAAIRVKLVDA